MPRLLLPVLTLAALVAACQPGHDGATLEDENARATIAGEAATLGEEPAATDTLDPDETWCNPDPVQALIGQKVTDALVEQALKDSGAGVSRILGPNTPATLDLNPGRLNVLTDADGVIQALRCE